MRPAGLLVGITAASTIAFTATPAHAYAQQADFTIRPSPSSSDFCTWSGASTSAAPPSPLTIGLTAASPFCYSGVLAATSDPAFTFNENWPGTALSPQVAIAIFYGSLVGTCHYGAINLTLHRQGVTREYSSYSIFFTELAPKRTLCPDTMPIHLVSIVFY
ncbi:hypothetical protein SAMN04489712_1229 [Thermomonospora echinospora]|uniref:Uncharacterized protein n=1 Tax=Thermomonospora echinospora TaxID=1992 RepID=A0A1H6DTA3_9ACTN|nr:hypothetical protein [Thermomonospora echinospora]SEG88469.1 hypothetical protein SAMN04489712_1229 [Thermomonospora echinospora]